MNSIFAEELQEKRRYEPIVIPGYKLSSFYEIPVNEIFLYSYEEDKDNWSIVPFQIDEVTKGWDPNNPQDTTWFYFIPEEWGIDSHDGVLSQYDELVFMVRDLGDEAPEDAWINNDESKQYPRLNLTITDPENQDCTAFGYLFQSSTITDEIPKPYGFEYFPDNDSIATLYYATDVSESGVIEDILIKQPWGTGKDIFDTQKFRFKGILDLFIPIDIILTEENLYLYDEKDYTHNPVVRLIRRVKQTLQIGNFISHSTPFYVRAKFYPFSGVVEGGTSISQDALEEIWPGSGAVVILENFRQSWDFSEDAKGMTFFNKYNQDVVVDGKQDAVDKTIDLPINEWSLVSGDQGSFFTKVMFPDTNWSNIELYYYDNQEGGQGDSHIFGTYETGDRVSFGDQGISFYNFGGSDISLELSFTGLFIPETNLQQLDGEKYAYDIDHPLQITYKTKSDINTYEKSPVSIDFRLFQNYPNPFNHSTIIKYYLPYAEHITLRVIDLNGRMVKILADGFLSSGYHSAHWDGFNNDRQPVASGIYFYQLCFGQYTETKKLTLIL